MNCSLFDKNDYCMFFLLHITRNGGLWFLYCWPTLVDIFKGLSSKPSGNYIGEPYLCFFESKTSNCGFLLIFWFALRSFCKVSARVDNIDIRHFIRVPPLMFFDFAIYQKFKGGTLIKCVISMLSNIYETLHS